jgi:hypothetical protein
VGQDLWFGGDGSALGANDDEQKRYVVQSIIDDRVNDQGLTEVRVRWRGYGEADDTWEKASSFDDGATLANYWRRKQNKKRARSVGPKPKKTLSKKRRKKSNVG